MFIPKLLTNINKEGINMIKEYIPLPVGPTILAMIMSTIKLINSTNILDQKVIEILFSNSINTTSCKIST